MTDALNATQGSLLGFLHEGEKTGWELLQEARAGLSRFWNVTQSHVYRELSTLERRKLIKAGRTGPRDRRPYRITAPGRRAFAAWIAEPPGPEQMRFPLLVTLWFGEHLSSETLGGFVAAARVEHAARLDRYEQISTSDEHVAAVVSFGIHYERAVLEWLAELRP